MTKSTKRNAVWGFTLIELMIVVAIIGILAAVAIPKFADLINKSKEGATRGSVGALRSAMTVYYGDAEGIYPYDDLTSLVPRYLASIPDAQMPPNHSKSNAVAVITSTSATLDDEGGWAYDNLSTDAGWGTVMVNCVHNDSKGVAWTAQ